MLSYKRDTYCGQVTEDLAGREVHLSGWVQIGVGSVGGKERDLSGIVGSMPKKSVKNTIEKIRAAVAGM